MGRAWQGVSRPRREGEGRTAGPRDRGTEELEILELEEEVSSCGGGK